MRSFLFAIALTSFCISTVAHASWLSKITGIDIDIPQGRMSLSTPQPQAIPDMLQHLPKDAENFFLNPFAGSALATLIRQAESQARGSAHPMPDDIRQILKPYFPPNVLNRALFTTRSRAGISLATAILEIMGDIAAVTVDDVIVFDNDEEAANVATWSHELVHITQYQNMGVEGFAAIYASPGAVNLENAAYSWRNHVVDDLNSKSDVSPVEPGDENQQPPVSTIDDQWTDNRDNAGLGQLTRDDFYQSALQTIPPAQCAQWQQVAPDAISIQNICSINLVISQVLVNGLVINCQTDICFIPAGGTKTMTGEPGEVKAISFLFLP